MTLTDRDRFYLYCLTFLNQPYRWGGDDPMAGFDCSGLILELYNFLLLAPRGDRTAQQIYEFFKNESHRGYRKIGALAFYGKDKDSITHIAMFLDENRIIEAGGGGRDTTTLEAAIKRNAFVRVRYYLDRTDLVDVLVPDRLPI